MKSSLHVFINQIDINNELYIFDILCNAIYVVTTNLSIPTLFCIKLNIFLNAKKYIYRLMNTAEKS